VTQSEILALIIDYGGVLMRTVNPRPRRELEQQFGPPSDGAPSDGALSGSVDRLVFESPLWDEVQIGRVAEAEFWADVGQQLGLDADGVAEFRRTFWAGDRLDGELVDLIRHLRDSGYRTVLLSNAPAGLRQYLDQLGIADAFDHIVISGAEGLMKPDPALFERALARVGVPAEQAVFVDDMRVNVDAAARVGLRAVRFRGLPPLRKCLRDLGVPVAEPVLSPLPDVRAVVFDWGGVMEPLPDDDHVAEWERRLALSPGTLSEILWGEPWRQLSVGAAIKDEYLRAVGEGLGFPDVETVRRFLDEFYADERFNPEVVAAARALRGRYQVALLSNAAPDQADWVRERFGLDLYAEFDAYINSAHAGLRKPDPAIFQRMLDHLDVTPEQAILVDDMLRNVDAACELGMHTVQFVDPDTSLGELEALLGDSAA
jgi:HAD superfamily hydrolase (TIGR01509 family)